MIISFRFSFRSKTGKNRKRPEQTGNDRKKPEKTFPVKNRKKNRKEFPHCDDVDTVVKKR
jgi:hypothetical protein